MAKRRRKECKPGYVAKRVEAHCFCSQRCRATHRTFLCSGTPGVLVYLLHLFLETQKYLFLSYLKKFLVAARARIIGPELSKRIRLDISATNPAALQGRSGRVSNLLGNLGPPLRPPPPKEQVVAPFRTPSPIVYSTLDPPPNPPRGTPRNWWASLVGIATPV